MNLKKYIFIFVLSITRLTLSMSAYEQQLMDAVHGQNIELIINLSRQKVQLPGTKLCGLVRNLSGKSKILCEWLFCYNLCNKQGKETYSLFREMEFVRVWYDYLNPFSTTDAEILLAKEKLKQVVCNVDAFANKIKSLEDPIKLRLLEEALLSIKACNNSEHELRNILYTSLEEKVRNLNLTPAESKTSVSPTIETTEKLLQNDNESPVPIVTNIHINTQAEQCSFYQKHNWLLLPLGVATVATTYLYQLHRLKKVERMIDDEARWINWQDIPDKDLLTTTKDEFLKKLIFAIFMKYKTIEEIGDPEKALAHFLQDISYEIKQLKYYINRGQSLNIFALAFAFGVNKSSIKDAEAKLKKAYYLKDSFMEWKVSRKPHLYKSSPAYSGN